MKTPPYAPWLVYATIVSVLGVLVGAHVPAPPTLVAARDLPRNHRLVPDDLKLTGGYHRFFGPASPAVADLTGRYLDVSRTAGAALPFGDTLARPQLMPPARTFALWLPLEDVADIDRDVLDAGSHVDVCGFLPKGTCLERLTVAAIVCGAEKPQRCYVGVWASQAQQGAIYTALDKAGGASPRVLLRDTGGSP